MRSPSTSAASIARPATSARGRRSPARPSLWCEDSRVGLVEAQLAVTDEAAGGLACRPDDAAMVPGDHDGHGRKKETPERADDPAQRGRPGADAPAQVVAMKGNVA